MAVIDASVTQNMETRAAAEQPRPQQQAAAVTADEALFRARGIIDAQKRGRAVPTFDPRWFHDAMVAMNDKALEDLEAAETKDCLSNTEGTPATDAARRKARDDFESVIQAARTCVLHDMATAPSRDAKLAISALEAMDEPPEPIVRAVHAHYCRDCDKAHRLLLNAIIDKKRAGGGDIDTFFETYRNRQHEQLDAIHAMRCAVAGALSSDAWEHTTDPTDAYGLIGAAVGLYCAPMVEDEDERAVALLAARWALCDALEALDAAVG